MPTDGTFRRLMALIALLIPATAGMCRSTDANRVEGRISSADVVYRHYV